MKVRVEVNGHQYFAAYEGEPLAWLQGLARGDGGRNQPVPCVVLKRSTDVLTVPLQHPARQITVQIMDEAQLEGGSG
jgi:hypothetical protein